MESGLFWVVLLISGNGSEIRMIKCGIIWEGISEFYKIWNYLDIAIRRYKNSPSVTLSHATFGMFGDYIPYLGPFLQN